jgi:hypothetical protein|tara:strand:+ start:514 stop:882 length:369 start_codon:yes stop_codon:yes gene_type:complete
MLFYSIVIAANVHKTLDKDNAGKLLRVLFPSYFLTTAILSLIALIFSIIEKSFINTILLFLILLGSIVSRQYLVPKINAERDLQISGNISSKKNFAKLHTLSVSINLLQIIILIILIINNLG